MIKGRILDAVSLNSLKGLTQPLLAKLGKLGIYNLQDLLLHLPLRYEDHTHLCAIRDLMPGMSVVIQGSLISKQILAGRRKILICKLNDQSGIITLRFFRFYPSMLNQLAIGKTIIAYGEIRRGTTGLEIIHPEYRIHTGEQPIHLAESLTAVYPTIDGLRQATLRKLIQQALNLLENYPIDELLPVKILSSLPDLTSALKLLHQPSATEINSQTLLTGEHPAQQRLIIEELMAHNLSMLLIRQDLKLQQAHSFISSSTLKTAFLAQLPFVPTKAQQRVTLEIEHDLKQNTPMMRLIQGDVGAGKTLVAALAALNIVSQGFQVALMAPTELLAEQHAMTFSRWFEPLGISIGWLVGKQKITERRVQQLAISQGKHSIIIGTHALFQEQINFHKLGLVIIDEQHRFGVHQRLTLWEKGQQQGIYPHQLIMTATPIPRTLAMTTYANLDISTIDELPPGRTPIKTVVLPDSRRLEVISRVKQACIEEKRQVYWVCTLIDESEVIEAQAAEVTANELFSALPELRIGLIHGRMKPLDKQTLMRNFKAGNLDLLVATTVIEVGVDVPNASLMIIDNPERLGLAQLHQLRGRVGRGSIESHCVLLYKTPLSYTAKQRLQVMRASDNGFDIAQKDLELRGPGEFLGTRQTGITEFKAADLLRDQNLLPLIKEKAYLLHADHPQLAEALIERWLGNKARYTQA